MLSRKRCWSILLAAALLMGCAEKPRSEGVTGARRQAFFEWTKVGEYSDEQLIAFLTTEAMQRHQSREDLTDHDGEFQFDIYRELARREPVELLLATFESTGDYWQKRFVVLALYKIDDARIAESFRRHLSDETTHDAYYIANYLAKTGESDALAILNWNYRKYPVSSLQWSDTVKLFGKHRHWAAAANLVASLDVASLNLSSAAYESLREIFPGEHPELRSPGEAHDYFSRLVASGKGAEGEIRPIRTDHADGSRGVAPALD